MLRFVTYLQESALVVWKHVAAAVLTVNARVTLFFAERQMHWNAGANTRTITVAILCVPVCIYAYAVCVFPPRLAVDATYVTIQSGSSVRESLAVLSDAHVISHPFWMEVLLRVTGTGSHILAGDYYFAHPTGLLTVFSRITSGTFGIAAVSFTVREGDTVATIAKRCEQLLFRCSKDAFIEKASSKEGYLFPDTYYVRQNTTDMQLIALLEETLYEKIEPLKEDIQASPLSLHELLTLASIIEKEEYEDIDRKMISGVLYNRLAIRMPLQVDATFLYIMGKGSFDLSRKDLAHDSPYNTYVYTGLPPGPIGSPSLSAITAAVRPTKNPYLFYLADAHGTTHYSKTYEEHLSKKRKYIDSVR